MKNFNLPKDYRPYIDKYFLRSKEILEKALFNPTVKLQVFIRHGACSVYGIEEATAIVNKYAPKAKVWSIAEGAFIKNCETIMLVEAPVQDIIDLETMYLGVISAETTKREDKVDINLGEIEQNMRAVVRAAYPRPVMYFGARHWRYDRDAEISYACFKGGASSCSTDMGASTFSSKGVGTIPHALEAVYHWQYGVENAVFQSTKAFHKHIDKEVPRIALIDYANREVLDSLRVANELKDNLYGIRIDTCGENYMQGVNTVDNKNYWNTRGVSIEGVYIIRKLLNDSGLNKVKIILSSGFANPVKVNEFVCAEQALKTTLFDSLGVGQVFYSRVATGDIIEVEGQPIHKVGRPYKENKDLKRRV